MKKTLISLIVSLALILASANAVSADGQTCVTQYGGAVVCGNTPPEVPHVPVKAGLGDINIGLVGGAVLIASTAAYLYNKRKAIKA